MSTNDQAEIQVAGDVCLDVVGIPEPAPPASTKLPNNWQLTGEKRTHFLLGGALLVANWIRAAVPGASVQAIRPCLPAALAYGKEPDLPLTNDEFLRLAERFKRDEIVHSLLELDCFRATPSIKDSDRMRIDQVHGFSGPQEGDPTLKLLPPEGSTRPPDMIVLDDTGNRFRRSPDQWPLALTDQDRTIQPLVVYKLHRPLPRGAEQPGTLWQTVADRCLENRIIIVSIDDLRDLDAPISRGMSWERTALDLVWQLLHVPSFAPLRDCPHLIVRMGLDGALYWNRNPKPTGENDPQHRAWLIYDPTGIEGTGDSACEGKMVGYGAAFTAALVKHLAIAGTQERLPLRHDEKQEVLGPSSCIEAGIKAGLVASRRLLKIGYGSRGAAQPDYPSGELFAADKKDDSFFACQAVPTIPQAVTPDRGYWRLLDSIFQGKTALLHRAVALTATNAEPTDPLDKEAKGLLKQVPTAVFAKALRTSDRREIENYRALYALLLDYIGQQTPRPLSVAVFGPPGAGKSFGVTKVAEALSQLGGRRPIETLTFNLSQYQAPEQLADAFHLVRDLVLRGKIPLVFFDEFDTSLGGTRLGWLRYFLAPMQDAVFLDRGTPHPIGQAIFVFAGGTCSTYAEFSVPFHEQKKPAALDELQRKGSEARIREFKDAKGPDFLSRLRGTLDVPGLDLSTPFDPFGPVEAFPCEAAILLRRAGILAYQLGQKAPKLRDSDQALQVSPPVLRALLHLPEFEHGNRSFEALLDMSRLRRSQKFTPSLLPIAGHVGLHANALHLNQLLATDYPFPPEERELIAQSIHQRYVEQRKSNPQHNPEDVALKDWPALPDDLKDSNREQADHIAGKLRAAGLWFRKKIPGALPVSGVQQVLEQHVETLAKSEHSRWVAEKRRQGWIAAPCKEVKCRNDLLRLHNCLFPWEELSEETKELDRRPVRDIPIHLEAAGYEIVSS